MSSKPIYSYQEVDTFLQEISAHMVYHAPRERHIKTNYIELHVSICDKTQFLISPSFTERLFCYTNHITDRIACKLCNNHVTYSSKDKQYHTYCSQRCAMLDMEAALGVKNASQLQSVKDKKKLSAIAKYGVEHTLQVPEIRKQISCTQKRQWAVKLKNMTELHSTSEFIYTSKEYYRLVNTISKWMYKTHIDRIDPLRMRGNEWHLDHKVSICYGYQNKISPNIIGDFNNLELLGRTSNTSKSYKKTITIVELVSKYNSFYSMNAKPPLSESFRLPKAIHILAVYIDAPHSCKYCSQLAHFINLDGSMQCAPSYNSCPKNKRKKPTKFKELQLTTSTPRIPYKHTNESKLKISIANKGRARPDMVSIMKQNNKIINHNTNTGKRWFNDGINSYLKLECPEGCILGRLTR
jgi:endogenous inhibitor of DNA gyrase (YacG/DUF329 family)